MEEDEIVEGTEEDTEEEISEKGLIEAQDGDAKTESEEDEKETEEEEETEEEKEDTSFKREMHDAVCADCGKKCEVPFKPIEGRPVYCRDCYRKHVPQRRRF